MDELKVIRLDETDVVKFGPDAVYQLILGDDEGTTPIRTGIQTSQPGYVAPVHSHPYMEVLHILDGVAEADRQLQRRREERRARLSHLRVLTAASARRRLEANFQLDEAVAPL